MLKHCDVLSHKSRCITIDNYAISTDYFYFIFHMCISACILHHFTVICKVLGKLILLENVCVDITLLIMERSIIKLRSSRYIGI